uniref:Uncharacterized protein n=1 Tax=Candidatus Kentrum sp. TC TaxID=2126339 RepID=A0A450YE29_9GAMM|nr:MAG: hypothetical protein BECKTC1821E_GA0114239_100561 [Candidatus Kentron sp. TC]
MEHSFDALANVLAHRDTTCHCDQREEARASGRGDGIASVIPPTPDARFSVSGGRARRVCPASSHGNPRYASNPFRRPLPGLTKLESRIRPLRLFRHRKNPGRIGAYTKTSPLSVLARSANIFVFPGSRLSYTLLSAWPRGFHLAFRYDCRHYLRSPPLR